MKYPSFCFFTLCSLLILTASSFATKQTKPHNPFRGKIVKKILKVNMSLKRKKCIPCQGVGKALSFDKAHKFLQDVSVRWALTCPEKEQKTSSQCSISQTFTFKNFKEAIIFVNKVAELAESEGHHPDITINWNRVTLTLTTHAINGLSENDFIVAAKIDALV